MPVGCPSGWNREVPDIAGASFYFRARESRPVRPIRRAGAVLAGLAAAVVALLRRAVRWGWGLATDESARPALLFATAMALGFASFAVYFLRGGGTPTRLELGLQLGSLGVVFYVSLSQAGTSPRR